MDTFVFVLMLSRVRVCEHRLSGQEWPVLERNDGLLREVRTLVSLFHHTSLQCWC